MKNHFLAVASTILLLAAIRPACAADLYVAANGSDVNSGTRDHPFATPEHARDVLRELRKSGEAQSDTVYFLPGTYFRSSTFTLDAADQGTEKRPIVYRALGKDPVIFHGGAILHASDFRLCSDAATLARLPAEGRGKVYETDLRKAGITNFGTLKHHGFGSPVEPAPLELFVNGEPQTLARYPNAGLLPIGKVYDQGSIPSDGDRSNRGAEFGYEYDRPARWTQAGDIWLGGKFSYGYADDNLRVERIDTQKRSFKLAQPHLYGVSTSLYPDKTKSRDMAGLSTRGYYAYNLLEELDAPGEWYLDRATGKLYLYPSSPLADARIEVSVLESPFVAVRNASHVRFEGIQFTCARGMAIYEENTNHVDVVGCRISNLGTVAVSMGQALGPVAKAYNADGSPKTDFSTSDQFHDNRIADCVIWNMGTGGVIVAGGDRKLLQSAHNIVENTEFHDTDRINQTYSPAIKIDGVGVVVRNCNFHDTNHAVILFAGNDHLFEYNRFARLCRDADDMGAIYTGRNPSARGTVIQYNYFSDIVPKSPQTSMCGVYFDDGSGGMTVRNNVFQRVGNPGHYGSFGAIYMHGGHDNVISGNIFMDCPVAVGQTPWDDKRWMDSLKSAPIQAKLLQDVDIRSDIWLTHYPALKDYLTNPGRRLNLVQGNVVIRTPLTFVGDLMLRNNRPFESAVTDPTKLDFAAVSAVVPAIKSFPFAKIGVQPATPAQ